MLKPLLLKVRRRRERGPCLPVGPPPPPPSLSAAGAPPPPPSAQDLRIQCRARGISPAGSRESLMERVQEDMLATGNL